MKVQVIASALLTTFTSFVAASDACHGAYVAELIPAPSNCKRHTKKGDTVTVDYKGYFPNGTVFDQSYGGPPFTYQYDVGQVIKGFDQGLKNMCVGEKRWVMMPPKFGYGVNGTSDGTIPPNSTLIFEILLDDIQTTNKTKSAARQFRA